MQAPLELINLLSRGVPMAEAKKRLGLVDAPSEESVPAGVSGGTGKRRKAKATPADTTPPVEPDAPAETETGGEADAPPVADGDKPAWMP